MRLGISLYPTRDNQKKILNYLDSVSQQGVDIVFASLLESVENRKDVMDIFLPVFKKCHDLNMEVMVDLAPDVYQKLKIKTTENDF